MDEARTAKTNNWRRLGEGESFGKPSRCRHSGLPIGCQDALHKQGCAEHVPSLKMTLLSSLQPCSPTLAASVPAPAHSQSNTTKLAGLGSLALTCPGREEKCCCHGHRVGLGRNSLVSCVLETTVDRVGDLACS